MSRVRGTVMLGSMMTYYRAWENRRFVRSLLREKQPEFADVLESAVREASCLQCDGSRCSAADELKLPHPRRRTAPSGRALSAARGSARSRPEAAALADSVNGSLYPIFGVERANH
jgi:hypothetical protein